jgi:hypothetical protein
MDTVQHPAFPNVTQSVDDAGPWVEQGWVKLSPKEAVVASLEEAPAAEVEAPAKNASYEAWAEYARSRGATAEDLGEMTRDQIRDAYAK